MKIRVISEFYDKFHTSTLFKVGTVLDFDEGRAKDIIRKKLAVAVVEPKPEPEVKVEEEPKTEEQVIVPESEVKKEPKEEPKRRPGRPKAEKAE